MSASTILQTCVGQGRSQPLNRSVMASACRKRATRQAVDRISESKLNTVERQNTTAKSTSLFLWFFVVVIVLFVAGSALLRSIAEIVLARVGRNRCRLGPGIREPDPGRCFRDSYPLWL